MIRHKGKLLWVFLLSAALVVTQLPAVAMAENKTPEDKSIASFEALPDTVKAQTVPTGTEESELDLPAELTAEVYRVTDKPPVTEDTGTPDADSDSGITVSTATEQIPVTWSSAPAYDSGAEGCYVFTADTGRYPLSNEVTPPQITVTVEEGIMEEETETLQEGPIPCTKTEGCTLSEGHEGGCVLAPPVENSLVKTITGWTFVDDDYLNMGELPLHGVNRKNQANFDTVVSMLPTQLLAEIEDQEESAMVDITGWTCSAFQQDGNGNWPITREYTFTAVLPTDYACDPFPTVKVRLGETDNPGGETGYFTVTGGSLNTDYKYENNVLTILKSTVLTITGSGQTTTDTIVVPNGVTANVTLQDVSIDVSSSTGKSRAFSVEAGGTSNITLSGTNILTSDFYYAGVEVPENASVTFDGDGSLTATSDYGAGIGSSGGSCGMISIYGGNITAISDIGAGIGGGSSGGSENGGSGGTISIYGGNVRATGGYGAGIGGGNKFGSGGTITISGGTVIAMGGNGAGIGGGGNGSGGTITISSGTVIAMGATAQVSAAAATEAAVRLLFGTTHM